MYRWVPPQPLDLRHRQVQHDPGAAPGSARGERPRLQHTRYHQPLVSVKLSEFSGPDLRQLDAWLRSHAGMFDTFFHALDGGETEERLIAASRRVLVGNAELVGQLQGRHPTCGNSGAGHDPRAQRIEPTDISVFTFGMHTRSACHTTESCGTCSRRLARPTKCLCRRPFTENTSFDDTFIVRFEELQAVFNGQIYFMGYLSDTAVFNHLMDATFLAAFFENGLRANNTTVNAAMECGCAVVTNLDEYSPAGYEHGRTYSISTVWRRCLRSMRSPTSGALRAMWRTAAMAGNGSSRDQADGAGLRRATVARNFAIGNRESATTASAMSLPRSGTTTKAS